MRRYLDGVPIVVVFLFLTLCRPEARAGSAPFEMPRQYTAEIETSAGGQTSIMQLAVDGDKTRMAMNQQGMETIVISRGDLKQIYSLLVAQQKYMVLPMTDAQAKQANPAAIEANAQWESLGQENVDGGRLCDKYKITSGGTDENVPPTVSTFYFDASTHDPVKGLVQAAGQQITIRFKKFQRTVPDASVFEVPKDYQKMTIPGLPAAMPGA